VDNIPAQGAHSPEGVLHGKGLLRDAAGELGIVVRDHEDEGVHAALGRQAGDGSEGFLGLAFHRAAVGDGDDSHAVAFGDLVGDGQALCLGQG